MPNDAGYTDLVYKDYINKPANRTELVARSDEFGVPPALHSHLTIFVEDWLVLESHVPADLLAAPIDAFERMVVYRENMRGALEYSAWAFRGEPQTFPINTAIDEYLTDLDEQGEGLSAATWVKDERVFSFVAHHLVERSSRRWMQLATGLGMIAIGLIILVWFV